MAFLEITLDVPLADRPAAAAVYSKYSGPFLQTAQGAKSKHLLIREDDVQVLHGFESVQSAAAYLRSELFARDIAGELEPLLARAPEIRIYDEAQ